MNLWRYAFWIAAAWTLFWLIAGFCAGRASAHDMYSDWTDRNGYSCCNGTVDGMEGDCRPTVVCETSSGGLGVRAEGRCVPVPANAILDRRPADGRTHVCMSKGALEPRCVVIGQPRS